MKTEVYTSSRSVFAYFSSRDTHFADKNTQAIFKGEAVKRVPLELQQNVLRKLQTLDAATCIADLQAIPGLH